MKTFKPFALGAIMAASMLGVTSVMADDATKDMSASSDKVKVVCPTDKKDAQGNPVMQVVMIAPDTLKSFGDGMSGKKDTKTVQCKAMTKDASGNPVVKVVSVPVGLVAKLATGTAAVAGKAVGGTLKVLAAPVKAIAGGDKDKSQ